MRITFVFAGTGSARRISGGYRVVYEYANRFVERGHQVNIVSYCETAGKQKCPIEPLRKLIHLIMGRIFPRWFVFSPKIRRVTAFRVKEVPDADVVIATALPTAMPVSQFPMSKGKKCYLIQDFENWEGRTDEEVYATYQLGMKNLVIAKWLMDKVASAGAKSILIPNAIDCNTYRLEIPIAQRNPHSAAMLYHEAPHKGAKYGIEVIMQLKKLYPNMTACLYGVPKRPVSLPAWIRYVQKATSEQVKDIYNQSAVYICPSINEGFGLPGAEAMACGCAYVSSDYGGQREYTEENKNVLLSPPGNVDEMVRNVRMFFDDSQKRIQFAENGYRSIQQRTWEKSLDLFEKCLR